MTYHRVTRVTRRVQHVEQELRTYPSGAHEFTLGFAGVHVARSSIFGVMF
jgi:hypothetical protein